MSGTDALQPRAVWQIFAEMSRIPRGSGNEAGVMTALEKRARERNLAVRRDAVGNLLVTIPASPGRERAAPVLVQGHVDMVCEKNGSVSHDFMKDPIRLRRDGDWVTAEGTTLGADNGIGCAMGLAIAETDGLVHGPIEVLLTVDEERGLTGASHVERGFFSARRMINLDSEEDHGIFIGCAGGRDTVLTLRCARETVSGGAARSVSITGLVGGHSGLDINRNRGNAIKILTRTLLSASDGAEMRIAGIEGGSLRNAIPREATATVVVPEEQAETLEGLVRGAVARIHREELSGIDDGIRVTMQPGSAATAFDRPGSRRILSTLAAIPNGVLAMSQSVPGLVESSTNLGVVRTDGDGVRIVCCSRSSVMSALDGVAQQHHAVGVIAGAEIEQSSGYPGWKPNLESPLLAVTQRKYTEIFGKEPQLLAIHAGLECGLLTEKYPDLDIVSFGPDIVGAHSPAERVRISSVERVWKLFTAVLEELSA
jgi:dipeptidase D